MQIQSKRPRPARSAALFASLALLGASGMAGAATTFDFTNSGGGSGGFGNVLQFTSDGISVEVHGWGETGGLQTNVPASYYYFQAAELYGWSTGLGICNQFEGNTFSDCDTNEREIDTVGRDDLLVLYFDQVVSFDNIQITVDPWDGPGSDPNDRDLRYWISTAVAAPDLSGYSFNTLSPTFGSGTLSSATSSYNTFTHVLAGVTSGNLLLLSGDFLVRNCVNDDIVLDAECEAWKLKSITVETSVIPVPAAIWLLGSGLLGLAALRRRYSA